MMIPGCFFLLLLWILATFSCRGFCCCCWSPDGKTPWQWRTEKPQNCTPKMPNVTSETHRKWWFWLLFLWILAGFSSCCCRRFCCCCWSPDGKTPWQWRTEKPQNCIPKMPNVTSETHRKWILATFSSCCCRRVCCCCCWSPDGKTPWQWRSEKPQNCNREMPNVTSETHRKWWFWLLFPLAAAMNFGYLFLQRILLLLLLVPGWENTMAVEDGEAPKLHPGNA